MLLGFFLFDDNFQVLDLFLGNFKIFFIAYLVADEFLVIIQGIFAFTEVLKSQPRIVV